MHVACTVDMIISEDSDFHVTRTVITPIPYSIILSIALRHSLGLDQDKLRGAAKLRSNIENRKGSPDDLLERKSTVCQYLQTLN